MAAGCWQLAIGRWQLA